MDALHIDPTERTALCRFCLFGHDVRVTVSPRSSPMGKLSLCETLFNSQKYCALRAAVTRRSFTANHETKPSSKHYSNQLLHFIKQKINLNGPMSVADYMRLTASSPVGGYYSHHGNKIFGEKVREQEVNSASAMKLLDENRIEKLLVIDDDYYEKKKQNISETCHSTCCDHLKHVLSGYNEEWQLVENGPGTGQLMYDITRALKQLRETKGSIHLVETSDALLSQQESLLCKQPSQFVDGKPYVRCNMTKMFSVFISNEFLDALPINQFKRDAEDKWHEWLITEGIRQDLSIKEWEISIDAGTYINQVADSITKFGGFVLIIDYGHDGTRKDLSLRAYKDHRIVHPLENPGEHDITADVNFGYLKSLVTDRTLVFGPIEQREFLAQMGIGLRLQKLLTSCETEEEKKNLIKSCEILMGEASMGARFKVMSIFPKTLENVLSKRKGPAGFAGA
ncbi:NADH dehydrogenase [ubiquinone] complex I, assembly factor 7 [Dirofilaria immitis]|nr:NADH dehydrogenase [ubiquinone] complex I, assembly factor 7 [Dirofilaria immitis]